MRYPPERYGFAADQDLYDREHGKGRWIIECWSPTDGTDESDEELWKPTIWRGVTLDFAMERTRYLLQKSNAEGLGLQYRCRDADTGDILLGLVLL
jgi:hypothetical protein